MIGRRPEEITGKPIVEIIGEEGFRTIRPHIERVLQGSHVEYESDVHFRGIGVRSLRVVYTPEPDERGNVTGWIASILDVTETKRAQQALSETQERLTGLINSAMDAVIAVDAQQRVVLFNPAAERMFGCPAAEAVGSSIERFIPARFRQVHRTHIEKFGQTGITNRRMGALGALNGLRADGEEFPIEAAISQMEVSGQRLFTVILRDITKRKKAEEQQSQLAAIVESSRDAILSKSLDGIVMSWNPGAEALFGYSAAEMVGQPVGRIIPPDCMGQEQEILKGLKAGQGVEDYETTRVTKAGRRVPVSMTISPIRDAAGQIVRASTVIRDRTERKHAEMELARAKSELERANHELEARVEQRTTALQQMIAELQHVSYAMVHDMRSPLRAMHAFAQFLLEESSRATSPQAQDYAQRIITAAARLDRLIQDALSYTRAVLQEVPLEPVDLQVLVRTLIATYPNLQSDQADIEIQGALPAVLGSESLLTQCFSNLLDNAVKFTTPGTKPRVRIYAENRDKLVRIWIEDNGIGIPENAQQRLFGMFERLTHEHEGTGIGLAIVRKVVERLGGKVGVESQPNKGCRFWLELRPAGTAPGST
jgi:PAS domain S-box-containing protein